MKETRMADEMSLYQAPRLKVVKLKISSIIMQSGAGATLSTPDEENVTW